MSYSDPHENIRRLVGTRVNGLRVGRQYCVRSEPLWRIDILHKGELRGVDYRGPLSECHAAVAELNGKIADWGVAPVTVARVEQARAHG